MSEWTDDVDGADYYDVLILLPSGIQFNTDYSVKVGDCGKRILLDVKLPDAMAEISTIKKILKRNVPGLGDTHPVFSEFTNFIKENGRSNIDDEIWRYYEIMLERQVEQKNTFVECIRLMSHASVVHVRLQVISNIFANKVRAINKDINEVDF